MVKPWAAPLSTTKHQGRQASGTTGAQGAAVKITTQRACVSVRDARRAASWTGLMQFHCGAGNAPLQSRKLPISVPRAASARIYRGLDMASFYLWFRSDEHGGSTCLLYTSAHRLLQRQAWVADAFIDADGDPARILDGFLPQGVIDGKQARPSALGAPVRIQVEGHIAVRLARLRGADHVGVGAVSYTHLDVYKRQDLLVDDQLIVELKAVDQLLPIHSAQVLTYLRLSGNRLGLLINFNTPLIKDGIKRIVL